MGFSRENRTVGARLAGCMFGQGAISGGAGAYRKAPGVRTLGEVSSIPFLPQPSATPGGRHGEGLRWRTALVAVLAVAALLWFIEIVDIIAGHRLDDAGIRPRSLGGLWGVLFAPLLHASIGHVLSNTFPLVLLGFVGLIGNAGRFAAATVIVWLTSGLGSWLVAGSNTITVGASGVILGWAGYLISRGWVAHRIGQALAGAVILLYFGTSLIWSVVPFLAGPHIAWYAHLFGFAGGVLAAVLLDGRRPERPGLPGTPTIPTLPGA